MFAFAEGMKSFLTSALNPAGSVVKRRYSTAPSGFFAFAGIAQMIAGPPVALDFWPALSGGNVNRSHLNLLPTTLAMIPVLKFPFGYDIATCPVANAAMLPLKSVPAVPSENRPASFIRLMFSAARRKGPAVHGTPPVSARRISLSVLSVYATCANHRSPSGQPSLAFTTIG